MSEYNNRAGRIWSYRKIVMIFFFLKGLSDRFIESGLMMHWWCQYIGAYYLNKLTLPSTSVGLKWQTLGPCYNNQIFLPSLLTFYSLVGNQHPSMFLWQYGTFIDNKSLVPHFQLLADILFQIEINEEDKMD